VLHLALHGYADLDYPDRSALAFAPEKNGADDGLLQVREIRHLGLNASLVTLSACNTGVGPVGQTGVANIANAFIEAGAQSVIATLWELEDRATIQLMSNFYTHLAHGMKKGEALRQAQLELLYSGQPPFYWASFEIVGEPDDALVHLNDLGSANNQPKGPEWSAGQKR
jgi:CHAT domain-containing protein